MDEPDVRRVRVERLPHGEDLDLPFYASVGSAGLDLSAAIEFSLLLHPLERALIPTGLCFSLPDGCEGQIRPRSGLALKHGLTVLNAPGTIDTDYRQEVKVILINLGSQPYLLERGDRIAQLVIAPFLRIDLDMVTDLGGKRDRGGFGSTGLKQAFREGR